MAEDRVPGGSGAGFFRRAVGGCANVNGCEFGFNDALASFVAPFDENAVSGVCCGVTRLTPFALVPVDEDGAGGGNAKRVSVDDNGAGGRRR